MYLQPNAKNYHVQYSNVMRHWSPRSEKFAGGDSLLTALQRGWEISETVMKEEHWHAGVRCVSIYHFDLRRGDERITMPVVENPYVTRFLFMTSLNVVEQDAEGSEEKVS